MMSTTIDTIRSQSIHNSLIRAGVERIDISVLPEVDSTNDWCRREMRDGKSLPFLCIAESQLAGKGRRGREWHTTDGGDIILSYARRVNRSIQQLGCLSLAAGLAVVDTLKQAGIVQAQLKWPNDVLVGGAKIAGVLIESVSPEVDSVNVIIGIGINANSCELPEATDELACMRRCLDEKVDREAVIAVMVEQLERRCWQLENTPSSLLDELDAIFSTAGEVDILLEGGQVVAGVMLGINHRGECRVQVEEQEQVFNSADVSLRKRVAV